MATDIDTVSLEAAKEIEDIFCRAFEGGRTQRLAAVQTVIAKAMRSVWDRRIEMIQDLSLREIEAGRNRAGKPGGNAEGIAI